MRLWLVPCSRLKEWDVRNLRTSPLTVKTGTAGVRRLNAMSDHHRPSRTSRLMAGAPDEKQPWTTLPPEAGCAVGPRPFHACRPYTGVQTFQLHSAPYAAGWRR